MFTRANANDAYLLRIGLGLGRSWQHTVIMNRDAYW